MTKPRAIHYEDFLEKAKDFIMSGSWGLTMDQRIKIQKGLENGLTFNQIGKRIGKSGNAIRYEVKREGSMIDGKYSAKSGFESSAHNLAAGWIKTRNKKRKAHLERKKNGSKEKPISVPSIRRQPSAEELFLNKRRSKYLKSLDLMDDQACILKNLPSA